MKKLLVALLSLGLFAPAAVFAAGALEGVAGIKLSNQVLGTYYSKTATDGTAYELSAGHAKGNRVYASGSLDQKIYYKAVNLTTPSAVVVSTDLISSFSDGTFDSDTSNWTAL